MAWAQYDPITQAKIDRQRSLEAGLRSADPVTRYQAKEAVLYDSLLGLGRGLVKQAREGEKIKREIERIQEQSEKSKYRALK